jgi:glycosyltransferase involved in cell wall biosynthesis
MSRPAPLISVITVVKDDVTGVIATLSSVFDQTMSDYEVIVQDGASTDGTTEALTCFGTWIDDLETAPDEGIYDAMNRALARARGEWVLFLNAGDTLVDRGVFARVSERLLGRIGQRSPGQLRAPCPGAGSGLRYPLADRGRSRFLPAASRKRRAPAIRRDTGGAQTLHQGHLNRFHGAVP